MRQLEQFMLERRFDIVRILEEEDQATVSELKKRFAVSEVTIRKDLAWLSTQRLIVRSYGGALPGKRKGTRIICNNGLNILRTGEKAIGMAAASLVQDGETIAIDASIFSRYLVRALGKFKELTVITYNLDCALELKGRSGICVLIPAGRINPGSLCSNLIVEGDFFKQFHIKRLFVGAKGFNLNYGLSDENEEELGLKKVLVEEAKEIIAFVDQSGWNGDQFPATSFCPIDRVKTIFTCQKAPANLVAQAQSRGIEVLLV